MSLRRPHVELPLAGQVDPETGRARCGWCGTAVQGRRVSWCSDDCVLHYKLAKGDQRAARRFLWKKERGVCQICLIDVNAHRRALLARHGSIPRLHRDRIKWEADHTIPIVEGGPLTASNLRTLCRCCHLGVTRALQERLVVKRNTNRAPTRLSAVDRGRNRRVGSVAAFNRPSKSPRG